jgi:hypothetical protein
VRAQVLGSPAENPDPDRAEATSGLCDPAAVAVRAVAVQEVADRGSATGEIQTQLQDNFARISRHTLNKRMGDFDGRHNTALPVGTPKNGSKVLNLNRNNLLATRPNGEAPIHLHANSFVITLTSIAPCSSTCYFSFFVDQRWPVGQSFHVTVFSPRFPPRTYRAKRSL